MYFFIKTPDGKNNSLEHCQSENICKSMRSELKGVTRKEKKVIAEIAQQENQALDSWVYKILSKKIKQNKAANNKKVIMPHIQPRKEIFYSGLLGGKKAKLVPFSSPTSIFLSCFLNFQKDMATMQLPYIHRIAGRIFLTSFHSKWAGARGWKALTWSKRTPQQSPGLPEESDFPPSLLLLTALFG